MKCALVLLLVLANAGLGDAKKKKQEELPPPCIDEEGIVTYYHGQMSELLGKIKQESISQFERNYHRKQVKNFLTFWVGAYADTRDCYKRMAQEPTTPKKLAKELEAKHESSGKQVEQVKGWRDSVRDASSPKDAKSVIEGIALPQSDSET